MAVEAYKALTDFECYSYNEHAGTRFQKYREGDVITDQATIAELVKTNCPVVPLSDETTVACPKCRYVFDSKTHSTQATIVQANCSFGYDYRTYSFAKGDIVAYLWLVNVLKAANVPLATVDATECPKCHFMFYNHPSTQNLRMQFARS